MLNRRLFVTCAVCAAAGLVATGAGGQTTGVVRTILQRTDAPGDGKYEIILVRGDLPAGAMLARHTHFGVETSLVVAGSGELMMQGQPSRKIAAGDSFQVPTGLPHAIQNDAAPMQLSSVFVVEKGKPLATPAPE